MSFAGDSARRISTSRAGPSSSSPVAITPPPMTTTSGLKMLTRFAIPTPSRSPTTRTAAAATGSPSKASSVISGPVSARPSSRATPSGVSGLARHPQRRLAHQRRPRRDRLEAAPVRAVALARRAVDVDHHVAHLGARARPAAVQTTAEHEAAADPRPDREQRARRTHPERRPRAPPPTPRSWRRCRPRPAGRAAPPSPRRTSDRPAGGSPPGPRRPSFGRKCRGFRSRPPKPPL